MKPFPKASTSQDGGYIFLVPHSHTECLTHEISKDPGRAEADFGRFDAQTVVRNIYILFSRSEIPIATEKQEIMDMVDSETPLPSWFTEEDLMAYGTLFQNSGFRTALKVPYRSLLDERYEYKTEDPKVEAEALLIMGEKDYLFKFPGVEDIINGEEMKKYVPNLEVTYVAEGSHFVQEQFPDQVNRLILNFIAKRIPPSHVTV